MDTNTDPAKYPDDNVNESLESGGDAVLDAKIKRVYRCVQAVTQWYFVRLTRHLESWIGESSRV